MLMKLRTNNYCIQACICILFSMLCYKYVIVLNINSRSLYLQMYVECKLNLCIATRPSDTCPDLCGNSSSSSMLVDSVFTSTYSVRSGPVSLLVKDFMNRNESATAEPANNTDATPTNNTLPTSPKTPTPTSAPGITPPASQIPSMTTTNNIVTGNTTLSQGKKSASVDCC